jgi:hypothetical protein
MNERKLSIGQYLTGMTGMSAVADLSTLALVVKRIPGDRRRSVGEMIRMEIGEVQIE